MDELSELLDGFQGSVWRVRCFAHILNLVVKVSIKILNQYYAKTELLHQSILSQFSNKTKATMDATEEAEDTATLNELDDDHGEENENEDITEDDSDEVDPAVAENDAAIVDEIAADVANDADLPTLTRAEVNLGRFAITKVT